MKTIGVTGGIGSGKSRILDMLKHGFGAETCQTDEVARELQKKGSSCFSKIVKIFGKEILDEDGELDRKRLGAIVFADEQKLGTLNEIVHPEVMREVKKRMTSARESGTSVFVIESALLLEAHYEAICDEVWCVYTKPDVRRKRLKELRKMEEEKILAVMEAQADDDTYRKRADVVIDNSGTEEETNAQIKREIERLTKRSMEHEVM